MRQRSFLQLFLASPVFKRRVHYIPRVNDDLVIKGTPDKPLTLVVKEAHDNIEILKNAEKVGIGRINIIAKKIHGDLILRHAPAVVNKVRIWVENLEGDVELPKSGLFQSEGHRDTGKWLRLHVGPLKDLAGQIQIRRQYDDVFNRLNFLERKQQQHEEDQVTKTGDHTEDYQIKVDKHPEDPSAVGEGSDSYYINLAEDDIYVMPRWKHAQTVPEVNIFLHVAHKGLSIN